MRHKFQIPKEDKFIRKIILAISLLLFIIILGTALFYREGGDISKSLFDTIALITHVNLDEVSSSYLFLLVSLMGYVTQFYILYVILEYVLEGKLRNIFSEVKILNQIKHMKDHYIICGGGRVGMNTALELKKYKRPYVVIEADSNRVEKLKQDGLVAISGDCTDEKELEKAQIRNARYFIACLEDDGDNILLVLTAKEMNPKLIIAARSSHENIVKKLQHAGAKYIIMPELLGGLKLAHSVIRDEMQQQGQAE